MADVDILIQVHEKARNAVSASTPPEALLAHAGHLNILAHDSYYSGRIARAYQAWAHSAVCLKTISDQSKSSHPQTSLPFTNETWCAAWTAVHRAHNSQRSKIDDVEARLSAKDVQEEEDMQKRSSQSCAPPFELDASAPVVPTKPQDDVQAGAAWGEQYQDISRIPHEELALLMKHFPLAAQQLEGPLLHSIWHGWQISSPPKELVSYNSYLQGDHAEIVAIMTHALEQVQSLYETSNPGPTSALVTGKGKGKASETETSSSGLGSSRDSALDRLSASRPASVFSVNNRLSLQSWTTLDSNGKVGTQGPTGADGDSISESVNISRWSAIKRPLKRLVKPGTAKAALAGEGSLSNAKRMSVFSARPTIKECSSCFDEVSDSISLTCQHNYCRECFSGMIISSSSNEAQWPPRCCMIEIPRQLLAVNLTADSLKIYHEKEQEYSVKAGERWYCTNVPDCGKFFIPKTKGQDTTTCIHCAHIMCTACRGPAHARGQRCASDRALEAMMQEAELEGWRQCLDCSVMVELNTGCRHITCRCGAQFCYTCGARWKTCGCTEADQTRRSNQLRVQREEVRRQEREREEQERQQRALREEEERELEAALEAVARQQEEDIAERLRAEEREALRLEEYRLLTIELTFAELQRLVSRAQMCMLESFKVRFGDAMMWLAHIEEVLREFNAREAVNLANLQGKHEVTLAQVQDRHEHEMKAFRKNVERYIFKHAMEAGADADESPLDAMLVMRDQATASYEALEQVQQQELDALKLRHQHVYESAERKRKALERVLLKDLDEVSQTLHEIASTATNTHQELRGSSDVEYDAEHQDTASKEIAQTLEQRKIDHATTAVCALKWWEYMNVICDAALADRKAHLISTGADAPDVPGVTIPDIDFESQSAPKPHTPTVIISQHHGSSHMPGSFPLELAGASSCSLELSVPSPSELQGSFATKPSGTEPPPLSKFESLGCIAGSQSNASRVNSLMPEPPASTIVSTSKWPTTLRGTKGARWAKYSTGFR